MDKRRWFTAMGQDELAQDKGRHGLYIHTHNLRTQVETIRAETCNSKGGKTDKGEVKLTTDTDRKWNQNKTGNHQTT